MLSSRNFHNLVNQRYFKKKKKKKHQRKKKIKSLPLLINLNIMYIWQKKKGGGEERKKRSHVILVWKLSTD